MAKADRSFTILMADDDAEDCALVREALRETRLEHDLRCVRDGEELFDYLCRRAPYADDAPLPDLILLDLKMPKMDGREVLRAIKADRRFRRIPLVVLTTSTAEDDIEFCYEQGVNSYVTKPVTFRGLVDIMSVLSRYWFGVVELPPRE